MCGKGAGPLETPGGIGWPARVTGPAPGSSARRPSAAFFPDRGLGFRNTSRSEARCKGRSVLIGQFVRDCSVTCYHNNPPREANRGWLLPRTGPTSLRKLHQAPLVPPLQLLQPLGGSGSHPPSRLPRGAGGGWRELEERRPPLEASPPRSQVLPGAWAGLAQPAVPPAGRRGRQAYPEPRQK